MPHLRLLLLPPSVWAWHPHPLRSSAVVEVEAARDLQLQRVPSDLPTVPMVLAQHPWMTQRTVAQWAAPDLCM